MDCVLPGWQSNVLLTNCKNIVLKPLLPLFLIFFSVFYDQPVIKGGNHLLFCIIIFSYIFSLGLDHLCRESSRSSIGRLPILAFKESFIFIMAFKSPFYFLLRLLDHAPKDITCGNNNLQQNRRKKKEI